MNPNYASPWHKSSYDELFQERLPQLLAERMPLVGYQFQQAGHQTGRVSLVVTSSTNGDIKLAYQVPRPDADGVFIIDGTPMVVVPTAAHETLDTAEIRCVGEQLYHFIEERLGHAPADLPWDETMARAWLPLDTWVEEFMSQPAQQLDTTNWLSRHTHLRRIIVLGQPKAIAAGQQGRVCPFECPEGPNLGRVFTVALGAEIRDGEIAVLDENPAAGLGLSASMIPFLEHSDPNRLLMGANMMRQWLAPADPEPAWVQTGSEPDAPNFWAGRNLLTAFVSWDVDTFSDGIVISESCAQQLNARHPAEPGDKLSNRHGAKGVVSRVLPDDQMPHLPDGTPVELVYGFFGLLLRMNFGQVREALMGRIAQAKGCTAIVPPFQAPSASELQQSLTAAGLSKSGMETLTMGKDGPQLQRPSTVGWVYWGKTNHLAQNKIMATVGEGKGQMQGVMENHELLQMGAYQNLAENLNTRSASRQDAGKLAEQVASRPAKQAAAPSPLLSSLIDKLAVAGIEATLHEQKLAFRLRPPAGEVIKLARPVSHPWLPEAKLSEIGDYPQLDTYPGLVEANGRLARMIANQTPETLTKDAKDQLEAHVRALFNELLRPQDLRLRGRQLFSGRTVIAPGQDLRLDQVGLADEIAWTLFGPLVIRELGDAEAVQNRSPQAAQALDALMARSWVIINRAPAFTPTALLAFRPVRDPGKVIRIHPLVCEWLNADFDGDQVAVMLPITEKAQCEAGELLSVAGHLIRNPALVDGLAPPLDALWGLANLSLSAAGRQEIAQLAGVEVAAPNGYITQDTLTSAMRQSLKQNGVDATLAALERLSQRGLAAATASGASMSPFLGAGISLTPRPDSDDPELWEAYLETLTEQIAAGSDYDDPNLGPQLLATKMRHRKPQALARLVGTRGAVLNIDAESTVIRNSMVEGLSNEEMTTCVAGARQGLAQWLSQWEQVRQNAGERHASSGFGVLARARRSKRPGIVFARAAAAGEIDPLADVESRLLVGLPIE